MRPLLILVLWAGLAHAVTLPIVPSYSDVTTASFIAANTLYCWTLPARATISATKLSCWTQTGSSSTTMGCAIYPDSDGGTALASLNASSASSTTLLTATGLSYTLTKDTQYRFCQCDSSTSPTTMGEKNVAISTKDLAGMVTAVVSTAVGTAANSCSSGVPPSTTGALSATTLGTNDPPIPVFGVE